MSQHYHGTVLKDSGTPANGATVNILEKGTVNLLTIYSDEACATSKVNPLTTDTYGRYDFYLKNEIECDIEISGTGITTYKMSDVDAGLIKYKWGTAIVSGNAALISFNVAHGLLSTPTKVQVSPASEDAEGCYCLASDSGATNIVVKFKTAPPAGTNNVKINWMAEV